MSIKRKYSAEIAAAVESYLKESDWRYRFEEDRGVFKFGVRLHGKMKELNYLVRVKEDSLIAYGIFPIGADSKDARMMRRMAEFICRCNYGLINGSFEMDFSDGEIRYKSFVDCAETIPPKKVIQNSIHCVAVMAERYSEGVLDIIFTASSPKDAVEKCEKDSIDRFRRLLDSLSEEETDDLPDSPDEDPDDTEDPDVLDDDLFGEGGDA